tara:strand:- start:82 stop:240 length:159 start_codon:yes stop_codon:yes gene_type:complete
LGVCGYLSKIEVLERSLPDPRHLEHVVLAEILGFTAVKQFDPLCERQANKDI